MTVLQQAKRKGDHKTARVNGKTINFVFGDSFYSSFIRQWEIDGVDKCPVECRYGGGILTLDCANGSIGTRKFKRSIKLEFLYEAIGWEDKIIEIEEKINQKRIAEVREARPEAKLEDYNFVFWVEIELDRMLLKIAQEQDKA